MSGGCWWAAVLFYVKPTHDLVTRMVFTAEVFTPRLSQYSMPMNGTDAPIQSSSVIVYLKAKFEYTKRDLRSD